MNSVKPTYNFLLAGLVLLLIIDPLLFAAEPPSSDDCLEYNQVFYTDPAAYSGKRIQMKPFKVDELKGMSDMTPNRSPQGTKYFLTRQPDFMNKGPWNTVLYIFGNKANPVRLKVAFRDHGNGGVRAQWFNEKLLSIKAWWGRILSTDMILDVESGEFVYIEDASYGSLIMPCAEKKRMMRGK